MATEVDTEDRVAHSAQLYGDEWGTKLPHSPDFLLRPPRTRRAFVAYLAALPFCRITAAQALPKPTFHILSLFHPQRLLLQATSSALPFVLDNQPQTLRRNATLTIDLGQTLYLPSTTTFLLEVPGQLRRSYTGTLAIHTAPNQLHAILTLDPELAVATIVAAESPHPARSAALAAQAIASRSFLLGAHTTHTAADFCDTTHCQFLADPPSTAALAAARLTAGLALYYRDPATNTLSTVPAMYSRSCGGRTRTLRELGLPARAGYPFYAVECAFCRAHPERWQRDLAQPAPTDERERIDYNRIHGWSALPSPIESAHGSTAQGRGTGHGIGLCQLGASAMAARGAGFAEILRHYYPNTLLTQGA